MHPAADSRERPFQRVPPGKELKLRPVIVVRGPARTDQSQIVGAVAQVRPPVADPQPGFAALLIPDLHRKNLRVNLVQPGNDLAEVFFQVLRFERLLVRRLADGLASVLVQLRLRVERLHLAGPTDHEQPDDGFRFRFRRASGGRVRAGDAVLEQHRAEGEAGKPHADVGEERAAGRNRVRSRLMGHRKQFPEESATIMGGQVGAALSCSAISEQLDSPNRHQRPRRAERQGGGVLTRIPRLDNGEIESGRDTATFARSGCSRRK